jgi:hypothetical protein
MSGCRAERRHRHHDRIGPGDVTAHYMSGHLFGLRDHPCEHVQHPRHRRGRRKAECNDQPPGDRAHGGDIGEARRGGSMAEVLGGHPVRLEVPALDQAVHADHDPAGHVEDCGVIAGPDPRGHRERLADPRDQTELSDVCDRLAHNAS